MDLNVEHQREEHLKEELNKSLEKLTGYKEDYSSKMGMDELTDLKKTLSDIHNLITLKATLLFCDFLVKQELINETEKFELQNKIRSISPNSTGYDIFYEKRKIVAEIKCNIPSLKNNGKRYGGGQDTGIKKDIRSLLTGKKNKQTIGFLKFMGIYQTNEKVDLAVKNLLKNLPPELKTMVKVFNPKDKENDKLVQIVVFNKQGQTCLLTS